MMAHRLYHAFAFGSWLGRTRSERVATKVALVPQPHGLAD
jgi:hypothetical protein